MKTPSDQLFRLIKSMSPAEKRYFKKERDTEGKTNQTLDLFDLINDQDSYDEEAIKQKLSKDASFVKNLKIHKNRLQQLLLKSLRAQTEEASTAARIRSMIHDVELLVSRQLFDLAAQTLSKAKELCRTAEQYELLVVVLGIESRWASYIREHRPADNSPLSEFLECVTQVQNYVQYANINQNLLAYLHVEGLHIYAMPEVEQEVRKVVEGQIETPGLKPISFVARRMHNHIFALWYLTRGEYDKAYEYTQASLDEFEANPTVLEEKNTAYIACLINHILVSMQGRRYNEAQQLLDKAFRFAERYPLPGFRIYLFYNQLRIYITKKQLKQAYTYYWQGMIQPYMQQEEQSSEYNRLMIQLRMIAVCLMLGKMVEAGHLLREVLQEKSAVIAEFLYVAYILELIYHLEQGDFDFIDNLTAAHLKRLQRNREDRPFFKLLLHLFRKLAAAASLKQVQELIEKHRKEQNALSTNNLYRFVLEILPYEDWLDARKNGLMWHEYEQKQAIAAGLEW